MGLNLPKDMFYSPPPYACKIITTWGLKPLRCNVAHPVNCEARNKVRDSMAGKVGAVNIVRGVS